MGGGKSLSTLLIAISLHFIRFPLIVIFIGIIDIMMDSFMGWAFGFVTFKQRHDVGELFNCLFAYDFDMLDGL